ncbi:uncharacterized protein LOC127257215 [Andrographis paniculata]|uniref:uncharacterized protein LOC127257215 n=1 Tax=Andrographis paniculata TaxID=175694 RepID=UPI0021E9A1A2|nr:uncharacterized protein LOC127257215 [Andrographis paniculata]
MDTIFLNRSMERSVSSQIRNPRNVGLQYFPSIHSENFFPAPAPASYSLPRSHQPPLLPLPPTAAPRRSNAARGQSCPPANKIGGRNSRECSLTPKKSNSPNKNRRMKSNCESPVAGAEDPLIGDMFSGSVAFTISPPPSSLPLPTFSLRPKLGCKAQAAAAGIDAGATDNLRRLLRLR